MQRNQIKNKSEFDLQALELLDLKKKLIEENKIKLEDLNLVNDHLIHGDYLDQNVFFDDLGKVKYVFDFEKTGFGPRT